MRKLPLITALTVIALQSGYAAAQVCYSAVNETTPDSRFVINEDGTVSDSETRSNVATLYVWSKLQR